MLRTGLQAQLLHIILQELVCNQFHMFCHMAPIERHKKRYRSGYLSPRQINKPAPVLLFVFGM